MYLFLCLNFQNAYYPKWLVEHFGIILILILQKMIKYVTYEQGNEISLKNGELNCIHS